MLLQEYFYIRLKQSQIPKIFKPPKRQPTKQPKPQKPKQKKREGQQDFNFINIKYNRIQMASNNIMQVRSVDLNFHRLKRTPSGNDSNSSTVK